MATRKTQPGGNPYNEEFEIPTTPKGKSDINRIELLENKVGLLTKLLFERSKIFPGPTSQLSIKKTLVYDTNLLVELVNNGFFASRTKVAIQTTISSKTTDTVYFDKGVTVVCNLQGLFPRRPLILTTVYMEKPGPYSDMQITVMVRDLTNQKVYFLEDVVI